MRFCYKEKSNYGIGEVVWVVSVFVVFDSLGLVVRIYIVKGKLIFVSCFVVFIYILWYECYINK